MPLLFNRNTIYLAYEWIVLIVVLNRSLLARRVIYAWAYIIIEVSAFDIVNHLINILHDRISFSQIGFVGDPILDLCEHLWIDFDAFLIDHGFSDIEFCLLQST